jgi:hypothetical protein
LFTKGNPVLEPQWSGFLQYQYDLATTVYYGEFYHKYFAKYVNLRILSYFHGLYSRLDVIILMFTQSLPILPTWDSLKMIEEDTVVKCKILRDSQEFRRHTGIGWICEEEKKRKIIIEF